MYSRNIQNFINKIKELFPDSSIILVMSGNFTQRGLPSIINKWDKTKIALQYGIDLVIELPYPFATQSADIFAKGAIEILNEIKLKCQKELKDYETPVYYEIINEEIYSSKLNNGFDVINTWYSSEELNENSFVANLSYIENGTPKAGDTLISNTGFIFDVVNVFVLGLNANIPLE